MDSENILSILAQLGNTQATQGILPVTYRPIPAPGDEPYSLPPVQPPVPADAPPQTNVLQTAMAPPPAPAPQPAATPSPVPVDHPRKRQSVIDVIGRLADVFAKVGGAEALYQPTLDARQDRMNQVDIDALKKRLTVAQVGEAELEPVLAARKRVGTALGALANNPNAAELWPSIAQQANIDPQQAAAIGAILQKNPSAAGIFAKALGADIDNLGKNVYFGTDASGKTVAYQVGPDGAPHILDFGAAGITPSDPIKVIDTGGASVIVGQGGQPKRILPKTARPDTLITTQTQRDIAAGHDRTQLTIAGMPARSKDGTGGKAGDPAGALAYLDNIERGFNDLHNMKALPGEGSGIGQIEGALSRTAIGQKFGEQFNSPAAQKRLELIKNINSLQSEMIQSLPGSATRTKFEQEIQKARLPDPMKMSYSTAQNVIRELRAQYQRALDSLAKEKAAKTPTKITPRASTDGWSVVGVK